MGGSMAEWESEKISYPIDMREGRGVGGGNIKLLIILLRTASLQPRHEQMLSRPEKILQCVNANLKISNQSMTMGYPSQPSLQVVHNGRLRPRSHRLMGYWHARWDKIHLVTFSSSLQLV